MSRAAVPAMRKQGWGRIINMSSAAAKYGRKNRAVYSASKAAIAGFTHSLGVELAPHGITVNMIAPGWIPVERHENDPQELKDGYRSLIPVNRWGVPSDLDGTVVYLASNASSFVTGQTLHVNGGMTVC